MPRRTVLKLAALIIASLGVFGCGDSEPETRTEAKANSAVVELRASVATRDKNTVLLRFGVPKGWKGVEDEDTRVPVAAIEKPQGDGDCRLFVQIVAGQRGSKGVLQPGEGRLLQESGADTRRLKVLSSGPRRSGTFHSHIYDSDGELSPTGPAAISVGELQISGDPAIPALVIVARGGLDGCTAEAPRNAVTETRAALRVLIEQMSVKL